MQGLPGSWKVHPMLLPRSTIPAGPHRPHPTGRHDAVPAIPTTKTPAILISELNTVASASAVYASSGALPHPHARLASGWWLAIAGRESNPLNFSERFLSSTSDFPFPRLILARRKVRLGAPPARARFPRSLALRRRMILYIVRSSQGIREGHSQPLRATGENTYWLRADAAAAGGVMPSGVGCPWASGATLVSQELMVLTSAG